MRNSIFFFMLAIIAVPVLAQQTPLWMRYPAISPDGKTIVFSYNESSIKPSGVEICYQ